MIEDDKDNINTNANAKILVVLVVMSWRQARPHMHILRVVIHADYVVYGVKKDVLRSRIVGIPTRLDLVTFQFRVLVTHWNYVPVTLTFDQNTRKIEGF